MSRQIKLETLFSYNKDSSNILTIDHPSKHTNDNKVGKINKRE